MVEAGNMSWESILHAVPAVFVVCKRCACVKDGHLCSDCQPGRLGNCQNARSYSTVSSSLPVGGIGGSTQTRRSLSILSDYWLYLSDFLIPIPHCSLQNKSAMLNTLLSLLWWLLCSLGGLWMPKLLHLLSSVSMVRLWAGGRIVSSYIVYPRRVLVLVNWLVFFDTLASHSACWLQQNISFLHLPEAWEREM